MGVRDVMRSWVLFFGMGIGCLGQGVWAVDALTPLVEELEQALAKSPSEAQIEAKLKVLFPKMVSSLETDAEASGQKALWGQSLNFDENAKKTIVPPAALDAVLRLAKAPCRMGIVVHAGFMHTYGYLLSNLETPFGYKRNRWLQGEIERGLNLPPGQLSPSPAKGTLFGNVTELLASVAIDRKYKATRIVEKLLAGPHTLEIFTDLVPFLNTPTEPKASNHLLVYSYLDSREKGQKLVTAFPVNQDFVTRSLEPSRFGDKVSITVRYNAYIEGVQTGRGRRSLQD